MIFVVNAKTGALTNECPGAVRNQMSWRRLAEALQQGGHVHEHEILTHLIVHDDRIELCFEMKPAPTKKKRGRR